MLRNPTFTLDTPFELPDLDYDELNFLEESDEDKPR
jgi:hypothetical protein